MQLADYKVQTETTSLGRFLPEVSALATDVPALVEFVQSRLIHAYWLQHYSFEIADQQRLDDMQLRTTQCMLNRYQAKQNDQTLSPAQKRVVGVCRDFSLLLCSALRSQGTPARIRCGFAKYFAPDHFEDHWVCEYWQATQQRWVMVDAQLDATHKKVLNFSFSAVDVPDTEFITAGQAWQRCRAGKEDPEHFGIHDIKGMAFIKGNLIRDIFALAKVELMAWDTGWGLLKEYAAAITQAEELEFLDELSVISAQADFNQAKALIENHPSIKIPDNWDIRMAPTIAELLDSAVET